MNKQDSREHNDSVQTPITDSSQGLRDQLEGDLFTALKVTDTPLESNAMVPRKYVNLNGTSANRPRASVIGQFYFDTSINKPLWWNGTGFVDGVGTYH